MKKVIAAILVCVILASFSISAFADGGINNVIIGQSDTVTEYLTGNSGYQMILATGDQNEIQMPDQKDYYYQPEIVYVDASKDHSVYVYQKPDGNKDKTMPFAFEGLKVYAVAKKGHFTCIVYCDRDFKSHAGWVYNSSVSYNYPGISLTIGSPIVSYGIALDDPSLSWSRERFVGTRQSYCVLAAEVKNCVQFKLDYQVTNRGGADIKEILGTRTIYVNDGSGWTAVGQFDFNDVQAYLVTVNLSEPMNIRAVAVSSTCPASDKLTFRMNVQDMICTSM